MRSCEACQGQMLEYLYDLLEAGERQQFEEHLGTCPTCQTALQQAREQQNLLAVAARLEFPQVTFQPPTAAPATLPLVAERSNRRPQRAWRRWALAAAVLLAVGLGIPASWLIGDYASASRTVEQSESRLAQLSTEMNESAEKVRQAAQQRKGKLEQVKDKIAEHQVVVQLTGPEGVPTGVPSCRIRTTNDNGKPIDANLTVMAQELGAALPVERVDLGEYRLTVPSNLVPRHLNHLSLVVSAAPAGGFPAQLVESVRILPPDFVTHLATDKPMYQPGEVVYFRSLTLERGSLRPAQEEFQFKYSYTTPTGAKSVIQQAGNYLRPQNPGQGLLVNGPDGKPLRGVGSGAFLLADNAPGGEYILEVEDLQHRFPAQQRKFVVNNYQKPRLNKELDFNRKTYGAGDEVQALCQAIRADGNLPVKDRPVKATVQIDGKTYNARGKPSGEPIPFRTDAEGKVVVRFKLPAEIEKGQASLSVNFDDGANTETLVRTIPIVVKAMDVKFFPEGGDLVAGLSNRVYFQALTPLGKPADIKGRLLEDGKPLDVVVQTLNDDREKGVDQGMGRFEFTPSAGKVYQLQIDSPRGIEKKITLPRALEEGVVLRVDDGLVAGRQSLKVRVQSTRPGEFVIGATCRDQLLGSASLGLFQSEAEIKFSSSVGGVCKVTVYEKPVSPLTGASLTGLAFSHDNGFLVGWACKELSVPLVLLQGRTTLLPRAERLIYRRPAEQLHLVPKPDRTSYVPGDKVKVRLESLNEEEQPTPAVVMVSVVDKSVLTLADEKTARTMPTHFLLTSTIKKSDDLEYADFLLGQHPRAAEALDLLLGVYGWRRIALAEPAPAQSGATPAALPPGLGRGPMRLAALPAGAEVSNSGTLQTATGQPTWEALASREAFARKETERVNGEYEKQWQALSAEHKNAEGRAEEVEQASTFVAASARLRLYQRFFEEVRALALPALALLAVLILLAGLAITLGQSLKQAVPCYIGGAACAVLAFLVLGLPQGRQDAGRSREMAVLDERPKFEKHPLPEDTMMPVSATNSEPTVTENRPKDEKATKGFTTASGVPQLTAGTGFGGGRGQQNAQLFPQPIFPYTAPRPGAFPQPEAPRMAGPDVARLDQNKLLLPPGKAGAGFDDKDAKQRANPRAAEQLNRQFDLAGKPGEAKKAERAEEKREKMDADSRHCGRSRTGSQAAPVPQGDGEGHLAGRRQAQGQGFRR